jgi:hypothetical protein
LGTLEVTNRTIRGTVYSFGLGCLLGTEAGCVVPGAVFAAGTFPGIFVVSYFWGTYDYGKDIWKAYWEQKTDSKCPSNN